MVKKKKMLAIFSTTIILIFCFFIGLYILGIRGDAYQLSLEFIDNNKLVSENIGKITNRRLALFGYSVRNKGPHGIFRYLFLLRAVEARSAPTYCILILFSNRLIYLCFNV